MKAIYFGDSFGDVEEERDAIEDKLAKNGIELSIKATDEPPWKKQYDILFFDWGGMSMGNDMLGHFCRWILEEADNGPGKVFIMTSQFTKEAMEDATRDLGFAPNNVYLDIEKALPILKFMSKA